MTPQPPGHDMQTVVRRVIRAHGSVRAFAQATGTGSRWLAEAYRQFWP